MKNVLTSFVLGLGLLLAGETPHAGEMTAQALVSQKVAILELLHSKAR